MITYFLAFTWGILILLSLIGWGGLINRLFFPKQRVDWGLLATWGTAFTIFLGGLLNVTWLISNSVIFIYLVVGIFAWLLGAFQHQNSWIHSISEYFKNCRKDSLLLIFTVLGFLLVFIQYTNWVSTNSFHPHDDLFGYFVFPQKMLQMGSMGADPFSGRRLISSLGGQSFLHTLVLCVLDEKNLHLIDPGIASIIVVGLILGLLNEKQFSPKMAAIIIFPFLLIIPPVTNTTSFVMSSALIFGLFRTLNLEGFKSNKIVANAFIISLLTSAAIASKATLIPSAILLFGLSYFFYIIYSQNKRTAISEGIVSILLTIAFLFPWMLSMYQSSGTFLFPILGKGYHASVYYEHYAERDGDIKWLILPLFSVLHLALFLLCVIYFQSKPWKQLKREPRGATLCLVISMILGAIVTIIVTNGYHERFTFPFVYIAIVVLIITLLAQLGIENTAKSKPLNITTLLVIVLVISMIIGNGDGWNGVRLSYLQYAKNIRAAVNNQFSVSTRQEILQYAKIQQSIPAKEILLTRLSKPFLLNFSRNPILIVDLPGYASPPPGMPLFKGSEALSDYLKAQSIRYIAYDYAKQPGANRAYWEEKLGSEIYPWVKPNRILEIRPFLRRQIQYTLDFHDNLEKLGQSRKKIYDDGKIFVIDLLD